MKDSGLGSDPLQRGAEGKSGKEVAVSGAAPGTIARWTNSGTISGAIGIVQVRGFVPMITAVDAMTKAANVTLVGYETAGEGITAAIIQGEVGAVRYAVEAGVEAARRVGEVVSSSILARPDSSLVEIVPLSEEDLRHSRATPILGGRSL